jgi:hypothetical protein
MGWSLFGSSGDSSSSSSSSTQTTTTTTTPTSGASDNSLAISATGNVALLEPGAVGQALDLAGKVNAAALEALGKTFSENVATLQSGFTQNVGLTTAALNKTTLDSGERLNSLVTTLAWAAVIGIVGFFAVKKFA